MGEIQKTASLKLNRALRKWTLTRGSKTNSLCRAPDSFGDDDDKNK